MTRACDAVALHLGHSPDHIRAQQDAWLASRHLSTSAIGDLSQCKLRWWLSRVLKHEPEVKSTHLTFGCAVHRVLELCALHLKEHSDLPQEVLETFYEQAEEEEGPEEHRLSEMREHVVRALQADFPEGDTIIAAESWLPKDMRIGGVPATGKIDLVHVEGGHLVITDWKTGKRVPKPWKRRLQFGSYVLAARVYQEEGLWPELPIRCRIGMTKRGKFFEVELSEEDLVWVGQQYKRAIEAALIACQNPRPQRGFLCDWCDFQGVCPAFVELPRPPEPPRGRVQQVVSTLQGLGGMSWQEVCRVLSVNEEALRELVADRQELVQALRGEEVSQ